MSCYLSARPLEGPGVDYLNSASFDIVLVIPRLPKADEAPTSSKIADRLGKPRANNGRGPVPYLGPNRGPASARVPREV